MREKDFLPRMRRRKNFPEDIFVDDGLYINTLDIPEFCKKYNIDEGSLENDSIIEAIISGLVSYRMNIIKLDNSVFLGPYAEDDK